MTDNVYQFEKFDISLSNWIKIFNCFKENKFLCNRDETNGFNITHETFNTDLNILRYETIYKRNGKEEEAKLNKHYLKIIKNIKSNFNFELDLNAIDPDLSSIKIINKFLGLTNEIKVVDGKILYRTKFISNYVNKKYKCIKANCGDLGGWIENPESLDYTSVVMNEAEVYSDSSLQYWSVAMNNVKIFGKGSIGGSIIMDNSNISNDSNLKYNYEKYEIINSIIFGNAKINNREPIINCRIYDNVEISGRVRLRNIEVYENAIIKGVVDLDIKINWGEDLFFKIHGNAKLISLENKEKKMQKEKEINMRISRADIYGDVQITEGSKVNGQGELLLAGYKIVTLNLTDFKSEYDYTYLIKDESKEKPCILTIE